MNQPWRGKCWGAKNSELGQALNAIEFSTRKPTRKARNFDSVAFSESGQYGGSLKQQNVN